MENLLRKTAPLAQNNHSFKSIPFHTEGRNFVSTAALGGEEIANAQNMMAHSVLLTLCNHLSYTYAQKIVRECGRETGEKYTYNFLDLEDSPPVFIEKLNLLEEKTGLHGWQGIKMDPATGEAILCFEPIRGCRGQGANTRALFCDYMQGLAEGIFHTYTGRAHCLKAVCHNCKKNGSAQEGTLCCFQLSPSTDRKDG